MLGWHILRLDTIGLESLVNGGVICQDVTLVLALVESVWVCDAFTLCAVPNGQVVEKLKACQCFGLNRFDGIGYRLSKSKGCDIGIAGFDNFGSYV